MFTDFSFYEASFTDLFQKSIEMVLYKYMTANLFKGPTWYKIVKMVQTGVNVCKYKEFIIWILATRMTGEMSTSLGNGFSNLMIGKYLEAKKNWKSFRCFVEGDDGAFSFYGEYPTEEDYRQFGMIIKILLCDDLLEGSFCGVVCDSEEFINVTDPIKALLKFGWSTRQYLKASDKKLMGLLRAKSLSMLYQYTNCPILDSLARFGERITRGYRAEVPASSNLYERNLLQTYITTFVRRGLPAKVPHLPRTRELVQKRFGIRVEDQFILESYLDQLNGPADLSHPLILQHCQKDWLHYARYINPVHDGIGSTIGCNFQLPTNRCEILNHYAAYTKK
jgi:hypothetical protein